MIKSKRDLWLAIAFYILLVSVLLSVSLYLNDGHFVFALDDPYIHMSMAKNFVNHGNWATNNMSFTSASSSPFWILLISAAYYVFGVSVIAPFIINILFQIVSIVLVYKILKYFEVTDYLFYAIAVFILVTPFMPNLFTGMEHSAQVTFTLLFIFVSIRLLTVEKDSGYIKYLLIITPVLTGLRYESMFIVSVVSLLMIFRKKYLFAFLIFTFGILPIVVYGIISISNGWYFLPNPILLKSSLPEFSAAGIMRFIYRAFKNLTEPHIFLLIIASSFIYMFNLSRKKDIWDKKQIFLLIVILTAIINMSMIEFHQNAWFYRYDAYLMAAGFAAIFISLYEYIPGIRSMLGRLNIIFRSIVISITVIAVSPFILRAFTFLEVPFATNNIYDQHFQMSAFVRDHLHGINLAANDIGMIDFCSDNGVLDLYGLSSMDVARDKLQKKYNTEEIDKITKANNIKLAIVYENGYGQYGGLPGNWVKIAEWTMQDYNFVCGYETTTFFSVDNNETGSLRKLLKEYSLKLPGSVMYTIY